MFFDFVKKDFDVELDQFTIVPNGKYLKFQGGKFTCKIRTSNCKVFQNDDARTLCVRDEELNTIIERICEFNNYPSPVNPQHKSIMIKVKQQSVESNIEGRRISPQNYNDCVMSFIVLPYDYRGRKGLSFSLEQIIALESTEIKKQQINLLDGINV